MATRKVLAAALADSGGPLTAGEKAWADAVLDSETPKKRRRSAA